MAFIILLAVTASFVTGIILGTMVWWSIAYRWRLASQSWEACFRSSRGF